MKNTVSFNGKEYDAINFCDILHANSPECEVKEYHPAPGKPKSGVGAKYLYELSKNL